MDLSNLTVYTPPGIDPNWSWKDYMGSIRVRLSIGRNRYQVNPGLYKMGKPGKDSEVIVTANYKLSFDIVRRSLKGMNAWVLVLQTYGINVWCAAGKGTFGTDELIRQINETQLRFYVSHMRLILPQLGAPGVSAHLVKEATGFSVRFGPVRAEDIEEYLSSGYKKDEVARTVQFNLMDRLLLTPVELANSLKYFALALVFTILLAGLNSDGYSFALMWKDGLAFGLYLLAAYITGAFLAPLFLPWLPFRSFGAKGLVAGLVIFGLGWLTGMVQQPLLNMIGWLLISGAVSSFLTMNFTGASTYTSLSGVRKEMRFFVPLQIALVLIGLSSVVISKLTWHG
jgi:acetyl-CoA decarbonylase/synthase complex subunit gamma